MFSALHNSSVYIEYCSAVPRKHKTRMISHASGCRIGGPRPSRRVLFAYRLACYTDYSQEAITEREPLQVSQQVGTSSLGNTVNGRELAFSGAVSSLATGNIGVLFFLPQLQLVKRFLNRRFMSCTSLTRTLCHVPV